LIPIKAGDTRLPYFSQNHHTVKETAMKHVIRMIVITLIFVYGGAFAEMAGKGGGTMSNQQMMSTKQTTQQMSQQMMSQEHMRNMVQFMQQMQSSVSDMNTLMQKNKMMNQIQLGEAARVMEQLSNQMRAMSQQMQAGRFDDKELAMLRQRHEEVVRDMKQLQQNLQNSN